MLGGDGDLATGLVGRRQEALEPVWQQLQGGTSGLWNVLFLPDIRQMSGS